MIALNLFRAQKASERAKDYSRRFKGPAYEKKVWSISLLLISLCQTAHTTGIVYGWKLDPNPPPFFPWVLYIDLPTGQASFHAAARTMGPDYLGGWDNGDTSANRIVRFVEQVLGEESAPPIPENRMTLTAVEEVADGVADVDYWTKLDAWKRKNGL